MKRRMGPPIERFLKNVSPEPNSGCWLWAGSLHNGGYGAFSAFGESRANRVSYRLYKGDIPPGMFVMHKCDNPPCVNPDHLEIGTPRDNVRDMIAKNRHCPTNLMVWPKSSQCSA